MLKALGQLGNNAGLIGALQHKLDDLVGMSSGFVESLHYKVRARVGALTEAQETHDELYGKFLEEKRALEDKYAKLYAPALRHARGHRQGYQGCRRGALD